MLHNIERVGYILESKYAVEQRKLLVLYQVPESRRSPRPFTVFEFPDDSVRVDGDQTQKSFATLDDVVKTYEIVTHDEVFYTSYTHPVLGYAAH